MFQIEDADKLIVLDTDKVECSDFEVTAVNYKEGASYECENSHVGARAALFIHRSAFDPKTAYFETAGMIVYACPRCEKPVMEV